MKKALCKNQTAVARTATAASMVVVGFGTQFMLVHKTALIRFLNHTNVGSRLNDLENSVFMRSLIYLVFKLKFC